MCNGGIMFLKHNDKLMQITLLLIGKLGTIQYWEHHNLLDNRHLLPTLNAGRLCTKQHLLKMILLS